MLTLRGTSTKPGWIALAPEGDRVHLVHLVRGGEGMPALRWAGTEPWGDPSGSMRAVRRARSLRRHRLVAVLPHTQYRLVTIDAPDLPREEWRDAIRWRLKDLVDFPVDSAGIDLLDIPADPLQPRRASVLAVAAARASLGPLVDAASDAGVPWQAIDVQETALRNLAALGTRTDRAEALLHVGTTRSTVVVVAKGELLLARHIEATLHSLTQDDRDARQQQFERASLELQRTLDSVERQFGQADLARLQVAPGAPLIDFIQYVRDLVYVPVTAFELASVIDLSAVPDLLDPTEQAVFLPAIGAALR
ncbi:MAG: hypothetical protein ABIV63_11820 [Caldimonas sp.]